jgi:hypothetical protein
MENRDWYGKDVLNECYRLRKVLQPISDSCHGPIDRAESANTLFPFVLLLGNHSSGKSSFINYILNRKVQQTGVAPTDDSFTIICPGETDMDKNGQALVGDPDLGFSGLKSFGPVLVNHTQLKVRANIAVKDFMIVDSPGMIDSPVSRNTVDTVIDNNNEILDRGYNFAGVCRWYAERADVILLFFDPDKPGTTGETLSILTKSLKGFDHKLHIILNKADQFRKIHDFARAYGSLCWNLSKVIARKDLPRIHTMCLPFHALPTTSSSPSLPSEEKASTSRSLALSGQQSASHGNFGATSVTDDLASINLEHQQPKHSGEPREQQLLILHRANSANKSSFFDQGFLDLEEARTEVIREAFNAPKRRVDNEISRLYEDVVALEMHCKVIREIVRQYNERLWTARIWSVGATALSVVTLIGMQYLCDYVAQRNISWSLSGFAGIVKSLWFRSTSPAIGNDPNSALLMNTNSETNASTNASNSKSGKASTASKTSRAAVKSTAASTNNIGSGNLSDSNDNTPSGLEETSINRDAIYQKIILGTGMIGLCTTAVATIWKYVQLHRHLQQYTPSVSNSSMKRNNWSIFDFSHRIPKDPNTENISNGENLNGSIENHHPFAEDSRYVLETIIMELHTKEFKKDDKFTLSIANKVLDHLSRHLSPAIIPTLPYVSDKQFEALRRIVTEDIANLRRRATPSFPALSPPPKMLMSITQPQESQSHLSPGAWTPSSVNSDRAAKDHASSHFGTPLSPSGAVSPELIVDSSNEKNTMVVGHSSTGINHEESK